jgi:hypothetical protein
MPTTLQELPCPKLRVEKISRQDQAERSASRTKTTHDNSPKLPAPALPSGAASIRRIQSVLDKINKKVSSDPFDRGYLMGGISAYEFCLQILKNEYSEDGQ